MNRPGSHEHGVLKCLLQPLGVALKGTCEKEFADAVLLCWLGCRCDCIVVIEMQETRGGECVLQRDTMVVVVSGGGVVLRSFRVECE